VLVPHPRYFSTTRRSRRRFAGMLMCSGLTAYAALKRLKAHGGAWPLLLVGLAASA